MSPEEARQILERYRPGIAVEPEDAELRSALELARSDQELGAWLQRHCEFQDRVRRQLRSGPVPADLKARLLARKPGAEVVEFPSPRRRQPAWLAAAAAILLCLGTAAFWLGRDRVPDSFADYRARMIRSVLREYRMDVRSADMASVRGFMADKGAPADFEVPGGLAKLELAGGGFLRWRSQPVAMICFHQGAAGMSYLFVLDRRGSREAPPTEPEIATVNGRSSAAWTRGDRIYLLTGAEGVDVRALL